MISLRLISKRISATAALLAATIAVLAIPAHSYAQEIPRELTKILALGDSITQGFSRDTTARSYRFPLRDTLLGTACNFEMVGTRFNNAPSTSFVSPHSGYSGHRVAHFLRSENFPGSGNPGIELIIRSQQPDLVLLHLGSNDMNRVRNNVDVDATIDDLQELVAEIWSEKPDVIVYIANIIPWFGESTNNNNPNIEADIASLGTKINSWVINSDSDQLYLVNVRAGYGPSLMQSDLVHPNDEGDAHIASRFIAAINANNDCPTPPITFISSPLDEDETLAATHTFTGSALDTDGDGIGRVRVAIENNEYDDDGSNQWWNFADGSFGTFSESIATLANDETPTSATWSKTVTLPDGGDFTFYALAVDDLGNQNYFNRGVWPTNTRFFTKADTDAPVTVITTPATNGKTLAAGSIALEGTASDTGDTGFSNVEIALRSRTLNEWYNFSDNSFSGAIANGAISANLSNTTIASTNWGVNVALEPGNYTLAVRAFDNAGNSTSFNLRPFTVRAPDTLLPSTTVSNPASNGVVFAPGTIDFTGTAADTGGSGFDSVEFAVLQRTNGANQWYNFSTNLFAGAIGVGAVDANLTATTNTSTGWNRSLALDAGTYTLAARSVDNGGNISAWSFRTFTVRAADEQDPTVAIDTPVTDGSFLPTGTFNYSGTATDTGGSGFESVEIAIRSRTEQQWYNFSNNSFIGAVGNGAASATLTSQSITEVDWNLSASLSPGNYTIAVRVFDTAGNSSAFSLRRFTVQAPDTQDPTVAIATPVNDGAVLPTGTFNYSGTATDAGGSGIESVEIAIRSRTQGLWYNFSNNSFFGAVGNGATSATLSNQLVGSVDWDLSASLNPGAYTIAVRVIDTAGNSSAFNLRRFRVQ